jgi:hypothetical protein
MVSRGRAARHGAHPSRGHRIGALATTAALAALAFSLVSTTGSSSQPTAHAEGLLSTGSLADASAIQALNDPANAVVEDGSASPQAASALAQAQARVQSLAAQAAQEAQAAQSAQAAQAGAAGQAQPVSAPASDNGTAGPDAYRAYAKATIGAAQFSCLDSLWKRESGWRPAAKNPHSTAYGIPQLLTATWAATGIAKTSNGYRQVDAGLIYIKAAYGTPCAAWSHSQRTGWY